MYNETNEPTFQKLLYNLGCLEPCFEILSYHINCEKEGGEPDSFRYQVISQTYILLAKLAHGQPSVQEILTEKMDLYVAHLSEVY